MADNFPEMSINKISQWRNMVVLSYRNKNKPQIKYTPWGKTIEYGVKFKVVGVVVMTAANIVIILTMC